VKLRGKLKGRRAVWWPQVRGRLEGRTRVNPC
jgi:hypothetical protein